jgi:hypothetical protein
MRYPATPTDPFEAALIRIFSDEATARDFPDPPRSYIRFMTWQLRDHWDRLKAGILDRCDREAREYPRAYFEYDVPRGLVRERSRPRRVAES